MAWKQSRKARRQVPENSVAVALTWTRQVGGLEQSEFHPDPGEPFSHQVASLFGAGSVLGILAKLKTSRSPKSPRSLNLHLPDSPAPGALLLWLVRRPDGCS